VAADAARLRIERFSCGTVWFRIAIIAGALPMEDLLDADAIRAQARRLLET